MSTTIAPVNNKYILKSLEEEIGLFDRKLAHLQNFETFENEEARSVAAAKLSVKRERLVRTMQELIDPTPEAAATAPKKTKTAAKTKTSTRSTKNAQAAAESVAVEPTHA